MYEKCHGTGSSRSVVLPYRGNSFISQAPQKENFSFCDTSRSQALPLVGYVFMTVEPHITRFNQNKGTP